MKNLKHIVEDYIKHRRKNAEKELRWFAIQKSLKETVSLAALAQGPSGKRLSHQRRIRKSVLKESQRCLLSQLSKLSKVESFDRLYTIVASAIGTIDGIGELTIYDTALRIGAKLGLEPDLVYLHAGTRVGARKLGLNISSGTLAINKLPVSLRKLLPREIEDVLCIYKDCLSSGQVRSGKNCITLLRLTRRCT